MHQPGLCSRIPTSVPNLRSRHAKLGKLSPGVYMRAWISVSSILATLCKLRSAIPTAITLHEQQYFPALIRRDNKLQVLVELREESSASHSLLGFGFADMPTGYYLQASTMSANASNCYASEVIRPAFTQSKYLCVHAMPVGATMPPLQVHSMLSESGSQLSLYTSVELFRLVERTVSLAFAGHSLT